MNDTIPVPAAQATSTVFSALATCVPLRTADGQARLRDMAAAADAVIEGFAPGVTDRWDVGYQTLGGLNPALVHCSITGFGRRGPYSPIRAYDAIVAAKAGVWARGSWS